MIKQHARVRDLLNHYMTGGMVNVARYLSDENLIIEDPSWILKMKRLLDSKNWNSMEAEIASLLYTFNLSNNGITGKEFKEFKSEGSKDRKDSSDND